MSTPQSAIVPQAGPFALYVQLDIVNNAQDVLARINTIPALVDELNKQDPNAQLTVAFAFSAPFFERIGAAYPSDLVPFATLGEGELSAQATQADMLVHLHSTRHDLHFYMLSKLLEGMAENLNVVDETYGFRYLDARDMTGFVDGTENPVTEADREEVAIIDGGEFAGGSFVLAQRFEHKMPAWNALSVAQQEAKIGRTKPDSIELDDVPADSHVGRVDIKEEGVGLKIVRHSLPYGSVSGEHGLLFLSYCNRMHNIQTMLDSMYGVTDGTYDQLLRFTKAVNSAYYFAPSQQQLAALA
ncbi:Dyp-type peroxidase [Vibrio ulleungensis]|uniref:Dyp-type peroxidase n=1 Tax=Vibrio ulleungensis TaxID=2807619 RepID=A0ABS2HG18_9VIBR|nr:Dyp-type peroxidase [Vibrio ulleungensis]MBM7036480.1 Dyp-type peroxidase [Vibrio ulleungensis]